MAAPMTLEKFRRLLADLLAATRSRRVRWQDTADEDTFRIDFAGGAVRVSRYLADSLRRPDEYAYLTALLNQNNAVAVELNSETEKGNFDFGEFFEAAKDSALRPDDLLDEIQQELKQKTGAA